MIDSIPGPTAFIDVISDVVCPWCYIGKRKLEAAIAELGSREAGTAVAVRWHPFQLNPDIPRAGIPRAECGGAAGSGPEREFTEGIGKAAFST